MSAAPHPGRVDLCMWVDPQDPVFAGHYPGFPVLPGLFLVDQVDRAMRSTLAARHLRPVALDRVRFRRPVRPGDTVLGGVTFESAEGTAEFVCRADLTVGDERVATVHLRYGARDEEREP